MVLQVPILFNTAYYLIQVYVLDENNQLVIVVDAKPMEVEKNIENITKALTGITGYDVRVRRLESNLKASMDGHA